MTEQQHHMLISRVIDGEATDQEWAEFVSLAAVEPRMWCALAMGQRDHAALVRAINHASAVADAVTLQSVEDAQRWRLTKVRMWSGWSVAALVALVAGVSLLRLWSMPLASNTGNQHAAILPISASEAFQTYLDKGQESGAVIGEVPTRVLIESRPRGTGQGYEIVYLRQIMERAVVPDLYQVRGQNELGQPTLIRYEPSARGSM